MKLTEYLRADRDREQGEARGRSAGGRRARRHVGCECGGRRRGGCARGGVTRRGFLDIRASPRNLIPTAARMQPPR